MTSAITCDGFSRRRARADYVEIGLDSPCRYNPLHNDLDAYALAYGIASLLNNLFGKGKNPSGNRPTRTSMKFIILLHKVLYDYVTLFDVYECAINPDRLAEKIRKESGSCPPKGCSSRQRFHAEHPDLTPIPL